MTEHQTNNSKAAFQQKKKKAGGGYTLKTMGTSAGRREHCGRASGVQTMLCFLTRLRANQVFMKNHWDVPMISQ